MKVKIKAYILFETLTALFVIIIALAMLQLNFGETKRVLNEKKLEVDYYLAKRIIKDSQVDSIELHDHIYLKKMEK